MDYEKAYKEALERAKNCLKDGTITNTAINYISTIFPELKESEDEKIRKWLLDTITQIPNNSIEWDVIEKAKVLSWLEKQGEQKATDKVEPKFKVGDWIIRSAEGFKHNTYRITEVKDYYVCEELKGRRVTFTFNDVRKNFKLWDISDAKDGDVLYSLDSNRPFIYKERKQNEQAIAYCGLNIYGKFFVWDTKDCVITLNNCVPATKEQRDLLFKKMQEAGYQWDPDKKELKKVEKIIVWSKEDEEIFENLSDYLENESIFSENEEDVTYFNEYIEWLKSLKKRLS